MIAFIATSVIIVEQFGFAIIPLCLKASSGLISGTTRGTLSSSLYALELSIYVAPEALIASVNLIEISFSAAPSTKSSPANASSVAS